MVITEDKINEVKGFKVSLKFQLEIKARKLVVINNIITSLIVIMMP